MMVNVRPCGAAAVGGAVASVAGAVAGGIAGAVAGGIARTARGTLEATTIAGNTVGAIRAVVVGADVAGPTVGAGAPLQLHAARPTDAAIPARRAPVRTLTSTEGMTPPERRAGSLTPAAAPRSRRQAESARPFRSIADSMSSTSSSRLGPSA
jgi:hypothetical protein